MFVEKKKIIIVVAALLAIAMLAFFFNSSLTGFFVAKEEVIKVGWMGPQTGQSAVLGMDGAVAAQIAVDEINAKGGINGRKIQLIIEDDQYNVAKAASAYKKLVEVDGVKIILANTYGSVFALAEQAKKDGVILIDPLDCNKVLAGLNDNVFCLATDSESIATALVGHATENNVKNVAIIHWNSDSFMPLVKDFFVEKFNNGEVRLVEGYSAGTVDFRTILLKAIDKNADAIVFLGYDETGLAMKQARELGFKGQFYTTGTITSPSLQKTAEGNAEGTIFAFWDAPKDREPAKSFTQEFEKRTKRPPILDLATYPTYDSVKVLENALKKASADNLQQLRTAILETKFDGTTGKIMFAQDGSVRIKESAYRLENGSPKPA